MYLHYVGLVVTATQKKDPCLQMTRLSLRLHHIANILVGLEVSISENREQTDMSRLPCNKLRSIKQQALHQITANKSINQRKEPIASDAVPECSKVALSKKSLLSLLLTHCSHSLKHFADNWQRRMFLSKKSST